MTAYLRGQFPFLGIMKPERACRVLHQLRYRSDTDAARLFAYCLRRATDREFFVRKAIGWALREYTKTEHRAVLAFLGENDASLSTLSKREAVKWIDASRRETSIPSRSR